MLALTKRYPRKRAFITGAASGLGAALCRQLAAEGWTIGMCDVRPEALAESVATIRSAGGTPLPYSLDVSDREAYAQVISAFLGAAGGVDLVVNNAGVAGGGAVGDYSLEDWEWLLKINLLGPVYGCHFFAPHLKEQRSGHIINIASAAALVPVPKMAAYCTAKAGVKMLSEVLSNELRACGVDVSVVMPEFFRTNLHERTRGSEQAMARKMITGAKYSAEDVADTVLREAGRRELYITFPRHTQLIWWLLRLSPELGNRVIRSGERLERKRRGVTA
jgi:NAD(P)-dependent dehydrogenase (short-subunit alcohol dehydrogenase family)